jgi:nitrogen regulatory protein PII
MSDTSLIVTIVRKGWGDAALEASMKAGAEGGTVLFGRGTGVNEQQKILGIPIEPEKEIVLTVVLSGQSETVLKAIVEATDLNEPGKGIAFIVPVEAVAGMVHIDGPSR